jgi:conjugative transfer pilus assembly protein TraH
MIKKSFVFFLCAALVTTQGFAQNADQIVRDMFGENNVNTTEASAIRGQTMNYYSGGGLIARSPRKSYQFATLTPPSWNAGCGGIDLYTGGFSHINKEQFVAMLRNIGSNAQGYAFKLAIQNLCPTCDNVMQSLENVARQINRLNIDSCEAAKGIVNAALPDSIEKGRQQSAINFGTFTNAFTDISDAWTNTKSNSARAAQVENSAKTNASLKDKIIPGNQTWRALSKNLALDDSTRYLLMSLTGFVVISDEGEPIRKPPIVRFNDVLGSKTSVPTVSMYVCDDNVDCKNPAIQNRPFKPFMVFVTERMDRIRANIRDRQAFGSSGDYALDQIIAFINATSLPVYKIINVSDSDTDYNVLLNTYSEMIAIKYAQVFVRESIDDVNRSLSHFSGIASSANEQLLKEMREENRFLMATINTELASAMSLAQRQTSLVDDIKQRERVLTNVVQKNSLPTK